MDNLKNINIQIYGDGANKETIAKLSQKKWISGFTTNPSLMSSEGIKNYIHYSKEIIDASNNKPVSFEILSDELNEMYGQAIIISKWSENVFVKIPIVNSKGESTSEVIKQLSKENVNLNITSVFTIEQVGEAMKSLNYSDNSIISIFAGRIADTGVDPEKIIKESSELLKVEKSKSKILWASSREIFNIFQAQRSGADIITVSHDLINKMELIGKDLNQFSLETSKMFVDDAAKSLFEIN